MNNSSLTFVLGGAKSGKSEFAEHLYSRKERICYIATGVVKNPDGEMQLRIQRHQARRSNKWITREQYQHVDELINNSQQDGYLLDDAIMLVTNLFYDLVLAKTSPEKIDDYLESASSQEIATIREKILSNWKKILAAVRVNNQSMVIVSDEVGLGVVPATKQTRILRDLYGEVNQLIAKEADNVYFVISGIAQKLK
ncbi:bifunctional adenosylcobinamide kinase/adenosylcobinamide-phosphate guanylyltransferase [Limosilactobacillus reuteri]|uniref:bifunctional adenosylcobinamide kinase/adenosylcobinamide-phosphate guanylyltransferase n=1 Tax=Limosilactobacillus reuteri TaxID=1598 RepID=UPI001E5D7373|nr:bifunctional adenosylcobinamide kinase/adenosylcobinamide-phosphate guanylyltransferase [Limosilactobacillus reuteri]MCC4325296.1 bifunctional adenosylcobinamide kinase/adenosylcobinamide-phosphate guanylyltransferase [Limosilactobacillus reuteri]MCC4329015.1 bifunctional adenosylcobinamide kinase/adenosylcobinamide-phosphate guanylyltransferase [Limosilactobacillus reuteri]MCC4351573.1 bifunctional adenosylcobinamide kinase/adenosylcobinamide-phosphate guanylyltransferase [Limosilactobacillu